MFETSLGSQGTPAGLGTQGFLSQPFLVFPLAWRRVQTHWAPRHRAPHRDPCWGAVGKSPPIALWPRPSPHLSEDRPDQRGQALGPRLPLDRLCRLQRQSEAGGRGSERWLEPPASHGAGPHPALQVGSKGPPSHGPDLLGAEQRCPLVQLAVWARPDGWGERPDRALLPVLGVPVNVGVLGAGLLAMPLRLPALIAVDELREEGRLLGIARNELVLQELLGGGPLQGQTWVTRRWGGRACLSNSQSADTAGLGHTGGPSHPCSLGGCGLGSSGGKQATMSFPRPRNRGKGLHGKMRKGGLWTRRGST